MPRKKAQIQTAGFAFGCTASEAEIVMKRFKRSACRKLSEYLRNMALGEPVKINYRNSSIDDLIDELIQLRNHWETNTPASYETNFQEIKQIINKIASYVCKDQYYAQHFEGPPLP